MSYNRASIFKSRLSKSKTIFMVADEYRTSPKSKTPGGSIVKVVYSDGTSRIYDKVKNVEAYISCVIKNSDDDIKDAFEIV